MASHFLITPTFSFCFKTANYCSPKRGVLSHSPNVASSFCFQMANYPVLSSSTNYARSDSPDRRYVGSFLQSPTTLSTQFWIIHLTPQSHSPTERTRPLHHISFSIPNGSHFSPLPPRYVLFLPYGTCTRTTSDLIPPNGGYVGILNALQDQSHHCIYFLMFSKKRSSAKMGCLSKSLS